MKPLHPHPAPAASLLKIIGVCALSVLGSTACQNALDLGSYDFTPPQSSGGSAGTGNVLASGAGRGSSGSGKNGDGGTGGGSGSPGGSISVSTAAGGSSGVRVNDSSDIIPSAVAGAVDAGPSDAAQRDAGLSDAGSSDAGRGTPDAAPVQCTKPSCRGGSGLLLDLLGGSR